MLVFRLFGQWDTTLLASLRLLVEISRGSFPTDNKPLSRITHLASTRTINSEDTNRSGSDYARDSSEGRDCKILGPLRRTETTSRGKDILKGDTLTVTTLVKGVPL